MITVSFTITEELAAELNEIAQGRGYDNAKQMVVQTLRRMIINKRRMEADHAAREPATQEAEEGIV